MRRYLLLAVSLSLMATGCLSNGRSLKSYFLNEEVEGRREADIAAAARVDQVGRQIVTANPLSGLEVTFQVLGHKEPILFHRDRVGVFISDSLVNQCRTDADLAAVLCSEFGKMVAEERNLARMGYVEPFAQVPTANPMEATNQGTDPIRMAEQAIFEQRQPRKSVEDAKKTMTDPKKIAAELLRSAGHDEKTLEAVEPILKGTNKNRDILKQLGGGSSEPTWSR